MITHHDTQKLEQQIDQVLNGLRNTNAPIGLESRINQRLQQTTQARTTSSSLFAVILNVVKYPSILFGSAPRLAITTIALITLTAFFSLHKHHTETALSPTHPNSVILSEGRSPQPKDPDAPRLTTTRRTFLTKNSQPPQPDPEAIALVETNAPSHPAPSLPLTPQERLLAAATRPGQPIEIAELELAREPALKAAAHAREQASIQRYAHAMLAPLFTAESFAPTSSQTSDTTEPKPSTH